MTTAEEAGARGYFALTTGFHISESALLEAVLDNLRRGKIPFILVTVGHGLREVWRLGRVQAPDQTRSIARGIRGTRA